MARKIGKYPFYTLLEGFGIDMAFNSEKDAKAWIKHQADLVYEGMSNKQKKERAEFRKQYRILTREEAKNFDGYIVPNIDKKVGSSYKDYAVGGEIKSVSARRYEDLDYIDDELGKRYYVEYALFYDTDQFEETDEPDYESFDTEEEALKQVEYVNNNNQKFIKEQGYNKTYAGGGEG
jgi:hypothetical protein